MCCLMALCSSARKLVQVSPSMLLGNRKSPTLDAAVDIYAKQKVLHSYAKPTDYMFMPEYPNRTTAVNTYRRIFNHLLQETGLKKDKDGNDRSPYSLRHYALQTRLVKSDGKVNIDWVAENAGTSVDKLERVYLKNLAPSTAKVRNIQSFGDR